MNLAGSAASRAVGSSSRSAPSSTLAACIMCGALAPKYVISSLQAPDGATFIASLKRR